MQVYKVTLYLRASLPGGSRPYLKAAYTRPGVLKPGYAIVHDKPSRIDGVYHARYLDPKTGKRAWHDLGSDPYVAQDKLAEIERALRQAAQAIPINTPARQTLKESADEYLQRVRAKRSRKTYLAYQRYLNLFRESLRSPVTYLDEITADMLANFETFLYRKYPERRGKKPQTRWNVFSGLRTFLRDRGLVCLNSAGKDAATAILAGIDYDEKVVDSLEPDELREFFAACTQEEYLQVSYFLQSGCRAQEVGNAELCDLEATTSTLHVQPKPHRRWKIKDKDDRFLPLPSSLVKGILAERAGGDPHSLLFPNGKGNVETHFLRKIKKIALRAGLNCGSCETVWKGCPVNCKTDACCTKWTCHALRRTYATIQHEHLGVGARTIQVRLGHSSLEVTQKYLKATDAKSKLARAQAEAFGKMFERTEQE